MTTAVTLPDTSRVSDLALQLGRESILATNVAGSDHPTPAMSAADVAAVRFSHQFHIRR